MSSVDGVHIAIFLREPRPGRVKTRLAKAMGPEAAADFYTAMLEDTVTLARGAGARGILHFVDGAFPEALLGRLEGEVALPQAQGDLGERLAAASRAASDRGCMPLLFLGSDGPDLPGEHLREALAMLGSSPVVLGPTADGGAWCIGLRESFEGFFDDLPWSSADTFGALVARAARLGLGVAEARKWSDVDEFGDLLALRGRLMQNPRSAPRCRAWLAQNEKLWNEAETRLRGT